MRIPDRRRSTLDEGKLSTQRIVTYIILLIFSGVVCIVFQSKDAAERSTVLQVVVNLTMLAVGFWLGSSKAADDAVNRMQPPAAPVPVRIEEVTTTTTTSAAGEPKQGEVK